MITSSQAAADYKKAIDELRKVALAFESTPSQRTTARSGADQLTLDYLNKVEQEIAALNKQYGEFIADLGQIIADLQNSPTLSGTIKTFQGMVETGAKLISAGTV